MISDEEEKKLKTTILYIIRAYKIDQALFPELGGPYFIAHDQCDYAITSEIYDELVRFYDGKKLLGT